MVVWEVVGWEVMGGFVRLFLLLLLQSSRVLDWCAFICSPPVLYREYSSNVSIPFPSAAGPLLRGQRVRAVGAVPVPVAHATVGRPRRCLHTGRGRVGVLVCIPVEGVCEGRV